MPIFDLEGRAGGKEERVERKSREGGESGEEKQGKGGNHSKRTATKRQTYT
jgi:hypothetical protein